jgi:hypothetical protein
MCDMESYADAVVGMVGEGLNVEQRKRLTIGVELAAKPQLLLFLDEVSPYLFSIWLVPIHSSSLLLDWTRNRPGRLSRFCAPSPTAVKPSCARELHILSHCASPNALVKGSISPRRSFSSPSIAFSYSVKVDRHVTLETSDTTPPL